MSTIQHPKGLILEALSEAGVPPQRLHEMADRIVAAYDELNSRRPPQGETPADSPGESPNGRAE